MRPVSIKRNYLYNTLYQIVSMVAPLVTAPYISRVLGSSGVGIYSYTNSIVTYFTLLAALGTASYGQREIAMHRDDKEMSSKLFWEIELLSVFTTGVATISWLLWAVFADRYNTYYAILTMSVIAVAFDISWYFGGLELFKYIVIRNTVVKLSGILLLFLFVKRRTDIGLYIGIMAATGMLGNISMWTYLPKFLTRVKVRELHPFRHLRQTFAYFIPTIATSVYTVLDKTMIGAITSSEDQNGYYEQATKIVRMIEVLLFSLNTVMGSRQSYLFSQKKYDEIKEKIAKSFDFLLGVSIAAMFGLIGIAENFVPWFFGSEYGPVIKLLYVMSPLPLIICVSNVLGSQYLTPSGQRVRSSKGIIAGAIVNLILNAIMIPSLASIGATIASVIAEAVISVIYMHMSKGYSSWLSLLGLSWKKMIAGVLMLGGVAFIGRGRSGSSIITLVQIVVGATIYCLVLLILRDSLMKDLVIFAKRKILRKE